jgi:quinol monooxygenase YgiN
MSKVILQGHILVPKSDLAIIKKELINHTRLTLNEPGCIVFKVTQCVDNPLRFNVYEEFINKSAFIMHQKRVNSSHWGEVTVNVERFYELI